MAKAPVRDGLRNQSALVRKQFKRKVVPKTPHVKIVKFERGGTPHHRHRSKWTETHCSECDEPIHKTSRFCVHCGAWFKKAVK
jgi:PHP family Zn ribbon phosphoesterase